MPCPDENTFAAFMAGLVSAEERASIEAHIDGCALCGEALAVAARVEPASVNAVPERVGRYQVLRTLGEGGMGVVLEAYDPTLDRMVALKLLRPGLAERAGARLVDEAQALARLRHPHVVAVLDAGVFEHRYYIAMERVGGITLRRWLAARPRTYDEVLDVFRQIADGLVAVHDKGLTHRDLKPENVLVDTTPTGVHATIIDFGLAKHARPDDAREIAGTLAYMAPEQVRGEPVTAAADQYAFCASLHEALHGYRPVIAGGFRTAAETATTPPMHPVADPVPAWMSQVLSRGLAPDAAQRFPSMRALRKALVSEDERTHAAQLRLNAAFQVLMIPAHLAVNGFFLLALTYDKAPDTSATVSPTVDFLAGVMATWVIGAFLSGWAPLGVFWAPINAYGLWRGRQWSYRSTVIYSIVALPSLIGTPFAVYAISTLWRRAFPKKRDRA